MRKAKPGKDKAILQARTSLGEASQLCRGPTPEGAVCSCGWSSSLSLPRPPRGQGSVTRVGTSYAVSPGLTTHICPLLGCVWRPHSYHHGAYQNVLFLNISLANEKGGKGLGRPYRPESRVDRGRLHTPPLPGAKSMALLSQGNVCVYRRILEGHHNPPREKGAMTHSTLLPLQHHSFN